MSSAKHRILIVDDDEDVHTITRLSLRGLRYRDRRLELLSATTGQEAVEIMRRQPGIAVILLDVVMESERAGLEACRVIRGELGNPFVRILLRTGQPGAAPEKKVIEEHDIDGYLAKGELTSMRLYTAVRTSLKAHGELMDLEALVAERTRELQRQKAENERLLLSILPPAIAERVRRGELRGRFEDRHDTLEGQASFEALSLASYMAKDRRQALVNGEELPEQTEGAALFADITGFTRLTEILTEELGSRRGAEELTSHLDRVYGAIIGEVHRYRGSVIGFSGDAITCWFEEDDGRRAVACALNMQRVMGWFAAIETPSGRILPLALKAAVTRGPVRRLQVGDPEIQLLDLLVGSTLERLAKAVSLAHQGEVVVGPSVVSALGERLQPAARDPVLRAERFRIVAGLSAAVHEQPWAALSEVPLDEARRWLLPAVAERLRSGQGQFLAELRPVLALFLAFDGFDFDGDADVGKKLDSWIRWVQKIVDLHGGSLIQLTTGDKGSYLYVTFGAPVALEDAAPRALATALELRSPPDRLSHVEGIRIGLSRGLMRAGEYGSETRRTYGVLSDETNLAARLMGKAEPGQILVGSRVALDSPSFRFRDLGKISVRGKRGRQPIFELLERLASDPASAYRGELATAGKTVGRRRELHLLFERLQALRNDRAGGLAVLEGEAGIGKTHLIRDLVHEADRLGGIEVVTGCGEAPAQRRAYSPWLSILGQLDGGDTGSLSEAQWIERLRSASERRPLLAVLDNGQWLDAESLRLIRRLRYEVKTLGMVVGIRPQAADPNRLPQDPEVLHLPLTPLSREQSLTIACSRLGVESLPEAAASWIHERAEGHPLFSSELAAALVAQGFSRVREGVCEMSGDPSAARIPRSIETLIVSTLDSLRPAEQLMLKVCSVVGGLFTAELLEEIYPVSATREELLSSLATLEQLRLLVRATPEPDVSYRFRHRITRDVAYELLLHSRRRHLHRSIAEWYERRHAGGLDPYYPVLASHWWRALQEVELAEPWLVTKAIDCLSEAGEQALREDSFVDAADSARRGLGLLGSLPRSLERARLELALRLVQDAAARGLGHQDEPEAVRNDARILELRHQLEQSGPVPIGRLVRRPESQE